MIRNLKALGLAFVAIFAISAVAASGAQAAAAHFRAGDGTGTATTWAEAHPNLPTQEFATDVGLIECEEVSAMASASATTSTETFTGVEYNECSTGGLTAEVHFNGCHYEFHAGEKTAAGSEGTADVVGANCATEPIEINAGKGACVVKVGPQTGLGPIKYTNVQTKNQKEEITLHAEVENIHYSWSGPKCGKGSDTNGVYEGTVTAWAESTGGPGDRSQALDYTTVST